MAYAKCDIGSKRGGHHAKIDSLTASPYNHGGAHINYMIILSKTGPDKGKGVDH